MVNSWSVMLVSLLAPLTAGMYWRRPGRTAASASMAAGLVAWLVLLRVQDTWPADLLAALVGAATFVTLGVLLPRHEPAAT
jgi:Na+/pantothenate symporter